jgi:methylmalonyl-CoA mutase C-terminal domain/subunit
VKILIAKPGLDGHDQGAKVVVHALVDAGFEVLYTGLHQSPEAIVRAAVEEDVDAVGLSVLSGAHLPLTQKVREAMEAAGIGSVPLVVGGNIPGPDRSRLLDLGAAAVFPTGSRFEEIVALFQKLGT